MILSPLNKRRLENFKSNKRGLYSFWIFTLLFLISLFADFIANEKPLLIRYNNQIYFPIINEYSETTFGGDFETATDYRDPYVKDLINNNGWMFWPIIPYTYDTIIRDLAVPAPAPPSKKNWLGTDDQARDVLARLIYGFRISILFGFTLTFFSMIMSSVSGRMHIIPRATATLLVASFSVTSTIWARPSESRWDSLVIITPFLFAVPFRFLLTLHFYGTYQPWSKKATIVWSYWVLVLLVLRPRSMRLAQIWSR